MLFHRQYGPGGLRIMSMVNFQCLIILTFLTHDVILSNPKCHFLCTYLDPPIQPAPYTNSRGETTKSVTVICSTGMCPYYFAELDTSAFGINATAIGNELFYVQVILYCKRTPFENLQEVHINVTDDVSRPNLITSLSVHWCKMNLKNLDEFGSSFNVFSVNNHFSYPTGNLDLRDQCGEHNESSCHSREPIGLNRINSFKIQDVPLNHLPSYFNSRNITWINLHKLLIWDCGIKTLPDKISLIMPNLQTLDLRSNRLTLPPAFPWNNKTFTLGRNLTSSQSLHCLRLKSCNIPVPKNAFLRNFFLDENKIVDLRSHQFHGYLHTLSIRRNRISNVSSETFTSLMGILVIDIGDNNLSMLPAGVFRGLSHLIAIALDRNRLTYLPDDIFDDLKNLKVLDVRNNDLLYIPLAVFTNLPKLEVAFLQNNSISHVKESPFTKRKLGSLDTEITTIHMEHNRLTSLPGVVFKLGKLKNAYFFGNSISFPGLLKSVADIDYVSFLSVHGVQTIPKRVFLRNNAIMNMSLSSASDNVLNKLYLVLRFYDLDISNNPVMCDCNAHQLHLFLKNQPRDQWPILTSNWKCGYPHILKGTMITAVPEREFTCNVSGMRLCPLSCKCHQRAHDKGVSVDCNDISLIRLPLFVPQNTTHMYFRNNKLSRFPPRNYIGQLCYLDLSDNELDTIENSVITQFNPKLELVLKANRLKEPPEGFRKQLRIHRLWMGQNNLICDCNTVWLIKWFLTNKDIIADTDDVMCQPQNRKLTVLATHDFVCEINQYIIVAVVIVVVVLIVIISLFTWYKYGTLIKVWAYSKFNWHPFDKEFYNDSDLIYDAFISYANEDYVWACLELLPKLESHHLNYSVCLHDRDFLVGAPIIDNITRAIRLSKRMIVVLSRDYLMSEWCRYEFLRAYEKMVLDRSRYLIVIKMNDDVTYDVMTTEMVTYMKTNTYLEVNSAWLWRKLFYVMPYESVIYRLSESLTSTRMRPSPVMLPTEDLSSVVDTSNIIVNDIAINSTYGNGISNDSFIHEFSLNKQLTETSPQSLEHTHKKHENQEKKTANEAQTICTQL